VVAWTDHRRTGYPRLIPGCDAAYGDADGSIFGEEIDWNTGETLNKNEVLTIRRLPYSTGGAKEVLTDIKATGLNALNESGTSKGDVQGTRLWWDIDKSNF
ncbi:MAG: SusD/RagB family nutrient-binding outer membrane lipoprotein, partial [Bacteroidaceae bacterium]